MLVSLVVRELCKPPDQGWRVPGRTKKAWKLPPGPAGMPIVGNLSQFFRARGSGRLIPYVRAQNFKTYQDPFSALYCPNRRKVPI